MKSTIYKSTLIMMLTSFGSIAQTQQFNTSGSHSFTAPDGVLSIKVEAVGAGGGGGRVRGSSARESGGGGGGAYAKGIINVTAGTVYEIGVGAAGVQNSSVAQHGGNSYFGSVSDTDPSTTVRAEGGKTLILSDGSNGTGAQGGQAANSVGNVVFNGGNGGNTSSNDHGGGGGGAAGSNGTGGHGGQGTPGIGTASYGGNGGIGGANGGNDNGGAGFNYGGGGGGARKSFSGTTVNRYGASGAQGLVVVSWSTITDFSPVSICVGSTEIVTVTGTNFTIIDSVTVNGTSVPFTAIDNTQFSFQVTSGVTSGAIIVYTENGASISSNTLTVNDYSVSVSLQGTVLAANYTGTNGATYQWRNCVTNTTISGAVGATFTPTQNGLYAVQVTENGCVTSSDCITVASLSLEEISESNFSIYPNPSSNKVTIETGEILINSITLVDLNGKEMMQVLPSGAVTELQLNDIQTGFYFVTIQTETKTYTKRLSVIK